MQITRSVSQKPQKLLLLAAFSLALAGTVSAREQVNNTQPTGPQLAANQMPALSFSRPEFSPATIHRPKHIKGAPASDGLEEQAPSLASLEELDDWLITHRRATWLFFDKLTPEDQQEILAAYQKQPDTALLTENVLRTYWQSRRHATSGK